MSRFAFVLASPLSFSGLDLEAFVAASLSAHTLRLVEERLKEGGYASADELVLAALETLRQDEGDVSDET